MKNKPVERTIDESNIEDAEFPLCRHCGRSVAGFHAHGIHLPTERIVRTHKCYRCGGLMHIMLTDKLEYES